MSVDTIDEPLLNEERNILIKVEVNIETRVESARRVINKRNIMETMHDKMKILKNKNKLRHAKNKII